eukprot:g6717.t1
MKLRILLCLVILPLACALSGSRRLHRTSSKARKLFRLLRSQVAKRDSGQGNVNPGKQTHIDEKMLQACPEGFEPVSSKASIRTVGSCGDGEITKAQKCLEVALALKKGVKFTKVELTEIIDAPIGCYIHNDALYLNQKATVSTTAPPTKASDATLEGKEAVMKAVEDQSTKLGEIQKFTDVMVRKAKDSDLSREWAESQTRLKYLDIQKQRRDDLDNQDAADLTKRPGSCMNERLKKIAKFSAIAYQKSDDPLACLSINRDELVREFCSFRKSLEKYYFSRTELTSKTDTEESLKKFWPNICCPTDKNNQGKETCEYMGVAPEQTIPFALAQGGKINEENLYLELLEALKANGYVHKGFMDLLSSVKKLMGDNKDFTNAVEALTEKMPRVFIRSTFCGPRTLASPENENKKICQLLFSYRQVFGTFRYDFRKLFEIKDIKDVDKMVNGHIKAGRRLLQDGSVPGDGDDADEDEQVFGKTETEKNPTSEPDGKDSKLSKGKEAGVKDLNNKPPKAAKLETVPTAESKPNGICRIKMDSKAEYEDMEKNFCPNDSIELTDDRPEIVNVALAYIQADMGDPDVPFDELLLDQARFTVGGRCNSMPVINNANDISIQTIYSYNIHTGEKRQEPILVMALDRSKNGYFQKELTKCKVTEYLPRAEISVGIYLDNHACCENTKSYTDCIQSDRCGSGYIYTGQ